MRIAISTDGGNVSAHFGRCPSFTIVDIKDGREISRQKIENPGHHPGFLPDFMHERGVNLIIAGGMGQRAVQLFNEKGIEGMVGVSGAIDDVINGFLSGAVRGGESFCKPGAGKGYGVNKTVCDHPETSHDEKEEC